MDLEVICGELDLACIYSNIQLEVCIFEFPKDDWELSLELLLSRLSNTAEIICFWWQPHKLHSFYYHRAKMKAVCPSVCLCASSFSLTLYRLNGGIKSFHHLIHYDHNVENGRKKVLSLQTESELDPIICNLGYPIPLHNRIIQ